ncbi:cell wall hydrolase [Sphingomonas gilva]|uniref:Cell wall hydrolase n=1 Tax=Sphingomonas gilva TaxID=2305907 RepID=A0A396RMN4_9SPHN|nr:cell wall hydrolase [Sphingomonas gilva]RHW16936.1 cell wall hydrolase [Sphingomonas gilva]
MHDRTTQGVIQPPPGMRAVVGLVALATIAAIVAAWLLTPIAPPTAPRRALAVQPVVPPTVVPPVEPIEYADVDPDTAREINAAVPFSTDPNPAARPLILKQPELDRTRAQDCLAAAMLYEAGSGDPEGQRAVAQVVINRMRHPAFPATICGVVFQGQERSTGCQFTFTCDGALLRIPRPEAWEDARKRAGAMLDGAVYKPVGHSTHYHTDWVVPYWSSSLDKVVAVNTHLFFRWTGWWGTPGAFRGRHAGPEPVVPKIGFLSEAHRAGVEGQETLIDALDVAALGVQPVLQDGQGTFVMLFDRRFSANDFPALAASVCADRPFCKLFAWSDRARLPRELPLTDAQTATASFTYLRNRAAKFERALWNCAEHKRPNPNECMKPRLILPTAQTQGFRLEPAAKRASVPEPAPAPATPPLVGPPPVQRTIEPGR